MNFDLRALIATGDRNIITKNHISWHTCLSTHIRSVFLSRNLNHCNGLNFLHILVSSPRMPVYEYFNRTEWPMPINSTEDKYFGLVCLVKALWGSQNFFWMFLENETTLMHQRCSWQQWSNTFRPAEFLMGSLQPFWMHILRFHFTDDNYLTAEFCLICKNSLF